jgi:hypothetical protein
VKIVFLSYFVFFLYIHAIFSKSVAISMRPEGLLLWYDSNCLLLASSLLFVRCVATAGIPTADRMALPQNKNIDDLLRDYLIHLPSTIDLC